MLSILTDVASKLPYIGTLLEKMIPRQPSEEQELEKIKLERDHVKALHKGKITPRMLMRYCLVAIIAYFGLLFVTDMFFPGLMDTDFSSLERGWEVMVNTLAEAF